MSDLSEKRRAARYEGVRNQKEQERVNEVDLNLQARMFRRTLEHEPNVRVVGWNYEIDDGEPLWFDACVSVSFAPGKGEFALVDLELGHRDPRSEALRTRKLEYAKLSETPYLRSPLWSLAMNLRIWKLRVMMDARARDTHARASSIH